MANAHQLYIDVGNTDIKWQNNQHTTAQRCPINDFSPQSKLYQEISQAQSGFISCMTHHPHYQKLQTILQPFALKWITAVPDNTSINLAYQDSSAYGIDRYLSLLAITDYAPFILVDLGTAITIDMMSSRTQHLGGWILPGLPMITPLFNQYGLTTTNPIAEPYQLGTDTPSATANGYQSMLITFLKNLSTNPQNYGLNKPNFILSGGNASQLTSHLPTYWQNKPNLVLQGLKSLALNTGYL